MPSTRQIAMLNAAERHALDIVVVRDESCLGGDTNRTSLFIQDLLDAGIKLFYYFTDEATTDAPTALVRMMGEREKRLTALESRLAAIRTAPAVLDLEVRRMEKGSPPTAGGVHRPHEPEPGRGSQDAARGDPALCARSGARGQAVPDRGRDRPGDDVRDGGAGHRPCLGRAGALP